MKFLKELQADTEINEKVSFPLMLQFIVPRAISFSFAFKKRTWAKKSLIIPCPVVREIDYRARNGDFL